MTKSINVTIIVIMYNYKYLHMYIVHLCTYTSYVCICVNVYLKYLLLVQIKGIYYLFFLLQIKFGVY